MVIPASPVWAALIGEADDRFLARWWRAAPLPRTSSLDGSPEQGEF
jgi:hypothetical protein